MYFFVAGICNAIELPLCHSLVRSELYSSSNRWLKIETKVVSVGILSLSLNELALLVPLCGKTLCINLCLSLALTGEYTLMYMHFTMNL
jgi:hypothetical protein